MEASNVRSMIELFENRCKQENATRLNKPLSKSFSALSYSEKKFTTNNQHIIHQIEDKLTSCASRIKKYAIYSKKTQIKHVQDLLQILISLGNIDTANIETIIAKKKEIVNKIKSLFKEVNEKLPPIHSFDFNYKPYSSIHSLEFKNEDTDSLVVQLGSRLGSEERLQAIPYNSINNYDDRKSPNIIVEDGNILGSVEKLKALFNTIESKQQVTENYSLKTVATKDIYIRDSMVDNKQTTTDDESLNTIALSQVTKANNVESTEQILDNETLIESPNRETSNLLNLNGRNTDGMQSVYLLKKLFEKKNVKDISENKNSTEDDITVSESVGDVTVSESVEDIVTVSESVDDVLERIGDAEILMATEKVATKASHNGEQVLEELEESFEDHLIELGGDIEEESNTTVLRYHPEFVKLNNDEDFLDSGDSKNEACVIS